MADSIVANNGDHAPATEAAPSVLDAAAVATELAKLGTTPNGLSAAEAVARLARYGRNAIEAHTDRWRKLATISGGRSLG